MWETLLLQAGLILLMRWLSGDKDSSAVEAEIFKTDNKDAMVELVVGKVVAQVIKERGLDPESAAVINDLVAIKDKTALEKFISKPETKVSIVDSIGNLLAGLLGIFGLGKK